MNGLIDKDTFYQKLDEHAADMNAEIWLSTANGEIIYCSNSESPAAKDMMITDFYDRTDIYSQTVKTGTLNGCFSAKTLSLSTPVYQDKSYAGLLSIHLSLQFIKDIAQKNIRIHLYAISGHCGVVSDRLNADHEQYIKTNP